MLYASNPLFIGYFLPDPALRLPSPAAPSFWRPQPEPDFAYNMFEHGLTELFVGAPGGMNQDEGMHGDELQQVHPFLWSLTYTCFFFLFFSVLFFLSCDAFCSSVRHSPASIQHFPTIFGRAPAIIRATLRFFFFFIFHSSFSVFDTSVLDACTIYSLVYSLVCCCNIKILFTGLDLDLYLDYLPLVCLERDALSLCLFSFY